MSRILRRPMFRGGKVIDSRGTGITSGLMDGGRVGYSTGDLVLGGDLYSKDDYTKFITNYADQIQSPALYRSIFTKDDDGNIVVKEDSDFSYENLFGQATGKADKPQSVYTNLDSKIGEGKQQDSFFPAPAGTEALAKAIKSDVTADLKASKQFDSMSELRGPAELGMTTRPKEEKTTNDNNDPEPTEIDPKTLMRENAELFKELLGADNEKKLKDARIQDVSNYLLKFFEGSQKEGATVGSSGAEVAAFATAKPSQTELAKQGIEKTDQTAMALAINDYIAGKRSKEQIDLMKEKLGSNFAQQIALIDYKNKKRGFFDILTDNRGKMSESKAIIQSIKQAFGKNAKNVEEGAKILFKENIGEYFIFPDGTIKTVIEDENGKLIEDTLLGTGG